MAIGLGFRHRIRARLFLFSIILIFANKLSYYFRAESSAFNVIGKTKIPGRRIREGVYSAFVPAPLPPEIEWTPRLIGALSDADRLSAG
jgi:hypothetical protein